MHSRSEKVSIPGTICYAIRTMYRMDRPYVFLLLFSMISMSALPFLNANLLSGIVNLAVCGAAIEQVIQRMLLILGAIVLLESADAYVRWFRTTHYLTLGHAFDVIVAQKTLSLRYEYAESAEVSDLRMRAKQVGSSVPVTVEQTMELGANLIRTLGCAAVFIGFEPILLPVIMVFTVLSDLSSRSFRKKLYETQQQEYPRQRKADYFLSAMLDGVAGKEIRVFSAADLIREKYAQAQQEVCRVRGSVQRLRFLDRAVGLAILTAQLTVIYLLTGRAYLQGGAQIGDVILYVNLILIFSGAFQGIFDRLLDIRFRGERLREFRRYMELDEEDLKKETAKVDPAHVRIEFEHVWFRYPGTQEDILKDVSFCFDERSRYAIVGENGCGKTTLIKLLMRFYPPTKGRILVNGVDYTTIDREQFYSLFTTVFQDFRLMAYSVAENIDFSEDAKKDREKIWEVLKKQGIAEKIRALPNGMDSCISQEFSADGINLSGGERQKIAIARADFKEAPVFVLDEPTSALDPIAEKKLYDQLGEMGDDRLMIIISHRLQSVMLCDRILYLKNGRITESGTHEELMKDGGDYQKMFALQARWYE